MRMSVAGDTTSRFRRSAAGKTPRFSSLTTPLSMKRLYTSSWVCLILYFHIVHTNYGIFTEMLCETIIGALRFPEGPEWSAPVSPLGKGICSFYIALCGGGESGSNLENYIFANRLAAAPPHEAGGLYPHLLLLARSPAPAGELLKTPALVRARQFLCSSRVCLRRYGIYGGLGILSKTSAAAFRASSALLNSSIAKCISLFSIVWATGNCAQ